jgi:hypothetical protein
VVVTHRQRFQQILEGGVPDRTAHVSRLNIWHNAHQTDGTLPSEVAHMTVPQIEDYLGMGHSARRATTFTVEYDGLEEQTTVEGDVTTHRFITPVGGAFCRFTHTQAMRDKGVSRIRTRHFIQNDGDYDVMRYVAEHSRFVPAYDAYREYDVQVGERGYPLTILPESPIETIMLAYLGYERFYYDLADRPERIEALLDSLNASYRQMWEVLAVSPARLVLHGVHFNSAITPPDIFRRDFLPYFQPFNQAMHRAGIKVAFHGDADVSALLDLIAACDFDVADCFATAPLVACTFDQAREAWGNRIIIWGAIPSIILEPHFDESEFRSYMTDLLNKTTGQSHFILAVSDNIMPQAMFDRLCWIRDLIESS